MPIGSLVFNGRVFDTDICSSCSDVWPHYRKGENWEQPELSEYSKTVPGQCKCLYFKQVIEIVCKFLSLISLDLK